MTFAYPYGSSRPSIVQIGGWLTSGKDAFADRLVGTHEYTKLAMGELILEFMLIENPWIRVTMREAWRLKIWPGFRRSSTLVDRLGYVSAKTIADFRSQMQKLGDAARTIIGTTVWADAMERRLDILVDAGRNVVYTGCRFPDELELFRSRGAFSLWIDRPGVEAPAGAHVTETALNRGDFDRVVMNDGSLADLHAKADDLASELDPKTPTDH